MKELPINFAKFLHYKTWLDAMRGLWMNCKVRSNFRKSVYKISKNNKRKNTQSYNIKVHY